MDLFAVCRIKSKMSVGLFWARGFASAEPDGLRAMVAAHCSPELCEAAIVDQPVAFVGAGFAARTVDLKSLSDWRPLIDDGERRPFLIRIIVRGKPYYYFRVGGDRTRLPGQPGGNNSKMPMRRRWRPRLHAGPSRPRRRQNKARKMGPFAFFANNRSTQAERLVKKGRRFY